MLEKLDICNCGKPEIAYKAIYKLLLALSESEPSTVNDAGRKKLYDILGDPYALTTLYMLDSKGFTAHGSSIFCSWLTAEGEELLAELGYMKQYNRDTSSLNSGSPKKLVDVNQINSMIQQWEKEYKQFNNYDEGNPDPLMQEALDKIEILRKDILRMQTID